MAPALSSGQDVLVLKWFYRIKADDLIVFKRDGRALLKRVEKIRNELFYVRGDNKEASTDSRRFGPILKSDVVGKVILIVR